MRFPWLTFLAAFGLYAGQGDSLPTLRGAAAKSPPALEDLLRRITERAEAEPEDRKRFEGSYAYLTTKTTERRDAANQVREQKTERIEHDPLHRPERPEPNDDPGYSRRDFEVGDDIFARYHFEVIGEEAIEGRRTWILAFEPADPAVKARNLKERFLNRIAGRAWIDQEQDALVRLEMHLTAPLNVVGGLVGAVKGLRVTVERERTADGLWFDRRVFWRLEGRRLFTTEVLIREEIRADVRKADPTQLGTASRHSTRLESSSD